MSNRRERHKPFLLPQFCKGCGRCIEACAKHCIELAEGINPETGLVPVVLHLEDCTACGLCLDACPEPYGLREMPSAAESTEFELQDPEKLFGSRGSTAPRPVAIPDQLLRLPPLEPLVVKGNYASAIGALMAGCRHFFGYPITPSTEGAELMAKLLPELDGVFLQAVSEVATVNMMYGCGGAGLPCMTFTSSPGFSLMLEGISYMVGSEVPAVFVNVMRGGPGLGNIAPEQSDIKLACRGLGHGNTHGIVLAPSTPQEMLDLTQLAFELSFRYRNPVVVLSDGYLGQMTGKSFSAQYGEAGDPRVGGLRRRVSSLNLINSIYLCEADLENPTGA
jgi:TPP-dependent indolepyruvate ferredoxin oxidoreductase alpha subunit